MHNLGLLTHGFSMTRLWHRVQFPMFTLLLNGKYVNTRLTSNIVEQRKTKLNCITFPVLLYYIMYRGHNSVGSHKHGEVCITMKTQRERHKERLESIHYLLSFVSWFSLCVQNITSGGEGQREKLCHTANRKILVILLILQQWFMEERC